MLEFKIGDRVAFAFGTRSVEGMLTRYRQEDGDGHHRRRSERGVS